MSAIHGIFNRPAHPIWQTPPTHHDHITLVADARLDNRADLRRHLTAKGHALPPTPSDADLILHAYLEWDTACPTHFIGDFAFVLWDATQHRLFCARDPFGVRPFFYTLSADCFRFATSLNTLRPYVSDALNQQAVVDFLLFNHNQAQHTTIFTDIHRLPPAHTLTITPTAHHLLRYWELPRDEIRFRRLEDYVETFREQLGQAVQDRMQAERIAILMSGGLDSTTIAALAAHHHSPDKITAYTTTFERLLPNDREGEFARLAADYIGIPWEPFPCDDFPVYEGWADLNLPQPYDAPLANADAALYRHIAQHAPIALLGLGGDPLLFTSPTYYTKLLKRGHLRHLFGDIARHLLLHRSPRGLNFRTAFKRFLGVSAKKPLPPSMQPDFEARWQAITNAPLPDHPHADAAAHLSAPLWTSLFEYDNRPDLAFAYPFFDIRLVRFVLAIPVFLCYNKTIMRLAMQGLLPEAVRTREKTVLAGDIVLASNLNYSRDTTLLSFHLWQRECLSRNS